MVGIFSWCLVEILKIKWDVICVWTCDMTSRGYFGKMNSTLGSVLPLAMFLQDPFPKSDIWKIPATWNLSKRPDWNPKSKEAAFTDWGPGQPNGRAVQNCACLRKFNGYRFNLNSLDHLYIIRSFQPQCYWSVPDLSNILPWISSQKVGRLRLHHLFLAQYLPENDWPANNQVMLFLFNLGNNFPSLTFLFL